MLGHAAEKMAKNDPRILAQDILNNPRSYQKNPTRIIKALSTLKKANESSKRDIPVYRQAIAMLKRLEKEAPKGRTIDKDLTSRKIRNFKAEELLQRKKVVDSELSGARKQIQNLPEEPEMVVKSDDWIEQQKREAAAIRKGNTKSVQKAAPPKRSWLKRFLGRKSVDYEK